MNHQDAFEILRVLDAPAHLVRHAQLVLEAAEALLTKLSLGELIDEERVRIGAVIHDAGKALHQEELHGPGAKHEAAGRQALLALNVDERYALICETHANWKAATTLDELLVTLADKLWKGKRVPALEDTFIQKLAEAKDCDSWELFTDIDTIFEEVAHGADARLARSG